MSSDQDPGLGRFHPAHPGFGSHTHAVEVGSRDDPPANVPHFLQRVDIAEKRNVAVKDLEVHDNGSIGPSNCFDYDTRNIGSGHHPPGVSQDGTVEPRQRVRIVEVPGGRDMPGSPPRFRARSRSADGRDPVIMGLPTDPGGPERQRDSVLRIDPLSGQNITVHMSLPVQDDIEDVLEECSRLRRIGHFTEVIALFRDRLSHFLDNRYVLVQYAQCLYDAGQYAQLERLARERTPPRLRFPDALQLNWDMLLMAADKGPYMNPSDDAKSTALLPAVKAVIASAWPELDSTQCQVLALLPQIGLPLEKALPRGDMIPLYRHLIDREMVWEFRDLIRVHLHRSSPRDVLLISTTTPLIPAGPFDKSPMPGQPKRLRELWSERAEDEPVLFALLDSFIALALHSRAVWHSSTPHWEEMMKACVAAADECGSALLALDDKNLITGPCLRWIVVKRMISDNNELLFYNQLTRTLGRGPLGQGPLSPVVNNLSCSRTVFPSDHLPMFNFWEGSMPQWEPRPVAPGYLDDFASTTGMVLRAAEELGDLELQTGCLKELMYRGIQPTEEVLPKLRKIWTTAGNKQMLLEINFFRALLAHTPSERKSLQRDLLLEIETGYRYNIINRLYLLAALSPDRTQQMAYREMAKAVGHGAPSGDNSRGTIEAQDGHSLSGDSKERTVGGPTNKRPSTMGAAEATNPSGGSLAVAPQLVKAQPAEPAHKRSSPARPARQLPAPAPDPWSGWDTIYRAPSAPGFPPVQKTHLAAKWATDSARQRIARIKDEMRDVERGIRSAQKGKDGREPRTLHNRLRDLEEWYRLGVESLENDSEPASDNGSTRDAPAVSGDSRVSGHPLSGPPRRRTTVEDCPGTSASMLNSTSDWSDNTENMEGERIRIGELHGRYGHRRATPLLEYPGHGDGKPRGDDGSDGQSSDEARSNPEAPSGLDSKAARG